MTAMPQPAAAEPRATFPDPDIATVLEEHDLPPTDGLDGYQEAVARVTADRYLHALRSVEERIAAAHAEYGEYIAHLDRVHARRLQPLERAEAWLEAALKSLYRFIPRRGKAKSVTLLAGRLGTRSHAARFGLVDDTAATTALALATLQTAIEGGLLPPAIMKQKPQIVAKELDAALQALLGAGKVKLIDPDDGRSESPLPSTPRPVAIVTPDGDLMDLHGVIFRPDSEHFYAEAGVEE